MEADFWHQVWRSGRTRFHEGQPNEMLVRHLAALGLRPGAHVFVPLCGKTKDIPWLVSQGFSVVGAELSRIAIDALFSEMEVVPEIRQGGPRLHYSVPGIDIHVGNIFDLTAEVLGSVDAIYDRAALIALPPPMRSRYAAHLLALTGATPQLLNCFEYDQSVMNGPPFSVLPEEVERLYGENYTITLLETEDVPGGMGGKPARDALWLLKPA